MKKFKMVIELEAPEELLEDTKPWEELEDEIRDQIIERFDGEVQGSIEDEATGNSTKICVPVCPHCGRKVLYLENEQDVILVWRFYRDGNYSTVPDFDKTTPTDELNHWVCPHCGKEIAETEEAALDFLHCH